MAIGIGLGMAEFPFSSARAFWKWVELCEEGGVDSVWQTDRLVSKIPFLETMSTMAALAGLLGSFFNILHSWLAKLRAPKSNSTAR